MTRTRVLHHLSGFLIFFCHLYSFTQQASRPRRRERPPSQERGRSSRRQAQPPKRSRESRRYQYMKQWVCLVSVTYQVVSEELHNEGRVLVALLAQGVELYGTS